MSFESRTPQDTKAELNLAPLVDCFTVLIAYLLVGASVVSLAVLDAEVGVPGPDTVVTSTPPPVLRLTSQGFRLEGANSESGRDEDLTRFLASRPHIRELVVATEPGVPYRRLTDAIARARHNVDRIYLEGTP